MVSPDERGKDNEDTFLGNAVVSGGIFPLYPLQWAVVKFASLSRLLPECELRSSGGGKRREGKGLEA